MSRLEMRLAGFGGQGIVLLGMILAKAIAKDENLHVVQTQSYGPESRGGAVRSDLVISDEPVDYPRIRKADMLVAMSQGALDEYEEGLKEGGTLVIDPDLVNAHPHRGSITVIDVLATRKATELGRPLLANMVMLGALLGISKVVRKEAVVDALRETISGAALGDNLKAVEVGSEIC
jgi:2-oxoglutarate ferredoxin oxidoreductase subunit gamma